MSISKVINRPIINADSELQSGVFDISFVVISALMLLMQRFLALSVQRKYINSCTFYHFMLPSCSCARGHWVVRLDYQKKKPTDV